MLVRPLVVDEREEITWSALAEFPLAKGADPLLFDLMAVAAQFFGGAARNPWLLGHN